MALSSNFFARPLSLLTRTIIPRRHYMYLDKANEDQPRVLITGGLGQLGINLSKILRSKYGPNNVLLTDIVRPSNEVVHQGPFCFADILDFKGLQKIIVNNNISWIVHFSALLSAVAEENISLALRVNIEGLHNIVELAKQYGLRLFIPSTIGAFGPTAPRELTPDFTIQRPTTIYGVAKVHAELMGEYYNHRFNMDFRSLRLPGVISSDSQPGGGTTDYAVHVFHKALTVGSYECYLKPDTRLPMIHIDDCLRGITEVLEADASKLTQRTYNLAALSFTPEELFDEVKKHVPELKISYKNDFRQKIADSWPKRLDDSNAKRDWAWQPQYNLEKLVESIITDLKQMYA